MARPHLFISAPRSSGGAYTHLANVLPRVARLLSGWDIELWAVPEVVAQAGSAVRSVSTREIASGSFAGRLRWEFLALPALLERSPRALVYASFGPFLNLALAPRLVWMSRNVIPLLPLAEWEVTDEDRARLLAMRP